MKNLEDKLQEACITWFKYQYPGIVIHHSKNEGNRKSIVMKRNGKSYSPDGQKAKRMGVYPGFADLFVMKAKYHCVCAGVYDADYYGLFIELKSGKNKQTVSQYDFQVEAEASGYQYSVCRSIDEFMNVVNDYLK